jgi:hypothetical protein
MTLHAFELLAKVKYSNETIPICQAMLSVPIEY